MLSQNPKIAGCCASRIIFIVKATNYPIVALVTHFSASLWLPGDKENLNLQRSGSNNGKVPENPNGLNFNSHFLQKY